MKYKKNKQSKKIHSKRMTALLLTLSMLLVTLLPVSSLAEEPVTKNADITWKRSAPNNPKVLSISDSASGNKLFNWKWSELSDLNASMSSGVWDGASKDSKNHNYKEYLRNDSYTPWNSATWQFNSSVGNQAEFHRFTGEFEISDRITSLESINITSARGGNEIGVNDIIYVFIYPNSGKFEMNDSSFMKMLAFWGGSNDPYHTSVAKEYNGVKAVSGQLIDLDSKWDEGKNKTYSEPASNGAIKTNQFHATDGKYISLSTLPNVLVSNEFSEEKDWIIDIFVADYYDGGGMDALKISYSGTPKVDPPNTPANVDPSTPNSPSPNDKTLELPELDDNTTADSKNKTPANTKEPTKTEPQTKAAEPKATNFEQQASARNNATVEEKVAANVQDKISTIHDTLSPKSTSEVILGDGEVARSSGASWALLNLILTIATGIMMFCLVVTYFTGKRRTDDDDEDDDDDPEDNNPKVKKHLLIRMMSVVATILAIFVFITTEDMTLPMVFTDDYTIIHVVIALVTIALALFSRKTYPEEDDDEQQTSTAIS